jgi:hypothetical protein
VDGERRTDADGGGCAICVPWPGPDRFPIVVASLCLARESTAIVGSAGEKGWFRDVVYVLQSVVMLSQSISGAGGLHAGGVVSRAVACEEHEEATTTDAAVPHDGEPLGPDEFRRHHDLAGLVAGAEPLASTDELVIEELTEEEADSFLAAIGG